MTKVYNKERRRTNANTFWICRNKSRNEENFVYAGLQLARASCNSMKRDVELDNGKPSMCPNYLGPTPPSPFVTLDKLLKALSQILAWKVMLSWEMCFTHARATLPSRREKGGEIVLPKYLKAHNTKDHLRTLLENLVLRVGYTWNEVAFQYTFWPQIFCPASKPFLSIRYCLFASRWVNSLTHEVVYSSLLTYSSLSTIHLKCPGPGPQVFVSEEGL